MYHWTLIGKLENPCSLAEVWKTKGAGSGPIHIAGNHALLTLGNVYAANEGCAIAGKECYEGRMRTSNHACLHRGAKSSNPKISIKVGIPECNDATKRWTREHSGVSKGCSTSVQNLVAMIPEWWSRCQVRMRLGNVRTGKCTGKGQHGVHPNCASQYRGSNSEPSSNGKKCRGRAPDTCQ